jgi:hypothetical protein
MSRLSLLLLALSLTPVFAADSQKPCPAFTPSKEKPKWAWMDGQCHLRTRAELDQILENHKLWLKKYRVSLAAPPQLGEASSDPLRADLTSAVLEDVDLTKADLEDADLTGADLANANLTGAVLTNADLTNTNLSQAALDGASLNGSDLTSANLSQADLSNTELVDTDFSGADVTLAKFWYADFAPKAPPLVPTLSPDMGLETVRWSGSGSIDELKYRGLIESARNANCPLTLSQSSLTWRWLVWLSRYRELAAGGEGWWDDPGFIWSDAFRGLQSSWPRQNSKKVGSELTPYCSDLLSAISKVDLKPDSSDALAIDRGQFELIDIRTALKGSEHSAVELEVNLAYQRHTQSWWKMIAYDWTCGYGTSPVRPLIFALALALLAIPVYWLGFRQRWFGSQIVRIETRSDKPDETFPGDPETRPKWREPLEIDRDRQGVRVRRLLVRLRLERLAKWLRATSAPCWPRLCWELGFLKSVVLFSLISVVNLGFASFDFGRWVRLLFFKEYDLKARGWLRSVSGLQSLIGLSLLALSLLSFFGHRFE